MVRFNKGFFLIFFVFGQFVAITEAESEFKVGVIAPLSGPLAEYGIAARNGIEMAVEAHPASFANIVFVYEDSQWVAKKAVSAFQRLRSIQAVSLVLNWGNPTTEAVAPLAERWKMPLIGLTLDSAVVRGKKYVVRSTNPAKHFSSILARYLQKAGYVKLGVVISQNTYVQGLYDGLEASLGQTQELEIIDSYNQDDHDFRSSVAKIRARNYDAIGVFLISGQVNEFYRQMSDQRVSVPTFGTDFFESSTEIRLSRGGMDGAVYTHLGIGDQFRKSYLKQHGNDLQIAYAGNWYDMAMLIGELFNEQVRPLLPEEIMKALRQKGKRKGVCGEFGFRETAQDGGFFEFPVQVKKIQGESIVVTEKD